MGPNQRPGQSEQSSSSLRSTEVRNYNYTKKVEETDHLIDAETVPLYFREMAGDDPKKQKNAEHFESIFEKTEALKAKGINIQHRVYFSGEDFREFLDGDYQSERLLKTVEAVETALLRFAPDGFNPPLDIVQFWGESHYEKGESSDDTKLFLYKGIPDEYIQSKLMVKLMDAAEAKDKSLARESQELLVQHLQPAALASQLAQAELGVAESSFAPEVIEAMGLIETDEFKGGEQLTTNATGTRLVIAGMPQFVSKNVLESPSSYTNFFWAEFARDPEEFFTRCVNEASQRDPQQDPTTSLIYQFAVNLRRMDVAMGDIHYECEVEGQTIALKDMHEVFNTTEKTNEAYLEVLKGFMPSAEVEPVQSIPEDDLEEFSETEASGVPAELEPSSTESSDTPDSENETPKPRKSWKLDIDWAGLKDQGVSAMKRASTALKAWKPTPRVTSDPAIEETVEQIVPRAPTIDEPEAVVVELNEPAEPQAEEPRELESEIITAPAPVEERVPSEPVPVEPVPETIPAPVEEPVIEHAYGGGSPDIVPVEPVLEVQPLEPVQPIQILSDPVRAKRIDQLRASLLARSTRLETQIVDGKRGNALAYAPVDIAEQSARVERFSTPTPDPENEQGPQVLDEVMPAEYWDNVQERYKEEGIDTKLETLESTIQRLNSKYKVEIGIDYLADIDLFKEAIAEDDPRYGVNLKLLGNVEDVISTLETTEEALSFYSPDNPFEGQRINIIWFDQYASDVQGTASRKGVTLKNGVEAGTVHHELGHVLDYMEGTNWERIWVEKEYEHAIARKRAIDVWIQRDTERSMAGKSDAEIMDIRKEWLDASLGERVIRYKFNGDDVTINMTEYIKSDGSFRGSPTQYSLTNGAEERAEIWREFAEGGVNRLDQNSKDRFEIMATGLADSGTLNESWFRSKGVDSALLDGTIT